MRGGDHGAKGRLDGSTIHSNHSLLQHQVIELVGGPILVRLKTKQANGVALVSVPGDLDMVLPSGLGDAFNEGLSGDRKRAGLKSPQFQGDYVRLLGRESDVHVDRDDRAKGPEVVAENEPDLIGLNGDTRCGDALRQAKGDKLFVKEAVDPFVSKFRTPPRPKSTVLPELVEPVEKLSGRLRPPCPFPFAQARLAVELGLVSDQQEHEPRASCQKQSDADSAKKGFSIHALCLDNRERLAVTRGCPSSAAVDAEPRSRSCLAASRWSAATRAATAPFSRTREALPALDRRQSPPRTAKRFPEVNWYDGNCNSHVTFWQHRSPRSGVSGKVEVGY